MSNDWSAVIMLKLWRLREEYTVCSSCALAFQKCKLKRLRVSVCVILQLSIAQQLVCNWLMSCSKWDVNYLGRIKKTLLNQERHRNKVFLEMAGRTVAFQAEKQRLFYWAVFRYIKITVKQKEIIPNVHLS